MGKGEPRLHFDVLLNVAEKLVFSPDNDFRLDLRDENADIVNFMFAGPACRMAFFSQFRRLTKLCVNSAELQLYASKPIQGVRGILSNNREFFQGPFVVSDKFFYVLLCQGVLRPTIIDTFFIFGNRGNDMTIGTCRPYVDAASLSSQNEVKDGREQQQTDRKGMVDMEEVRFDQSETITEGESPAESLVRLFLFKDFPETLDIIPKEELAECDLNLEFLKIHDDVTIYNHINRILNLNSESVLLEISTELRDIVRTLNFSDKISADRTNKFVLTYTIDVIDPNSETGFSFPVNDFLALLRHISSRCPKLSSCAVSFLLQGEFTDEDFKQLSSWLYRVLLSLVSRSQHILGMIECALTIAFRAFFPESTLMEANKTGHVLARMGEQRRLDEGDAIEIDVPDTYTITRKIQLREKPLVRVIYSLIGLEDDSLNDGWNGFHGQLPIHQQPAGGMPFPGFVALDNALAVINGESQENDSNTVSAAMLFNQPSGNQPNGGDLSDF